MISNLFPDHLTQHLRIIDSASVANGTLTLAFSPTFAATPGPSDYSARLKITNDGGADYEVIAQTPTQGFVTWRIVFSFAGATAADPGTIFVLDNAGAGLAFINTNTVWTENLYKTVAVQFVPGGQIRYFYDGVLFYTDVDQSNNGTGTMVEQLLFGSDNFQLDANENADVDLVSIAPAAATTGACCEPDGDCNLTTPAACVAPNVFRGLGTACEAGSCVGKCCQPDGFCAVLPAGQCVGAGFTYAGNGTVCGPAGECLGRCCLPDGSCLDDGPAPCALNGGTFGGVASVCLGFESLCVGRCCVGNACTPAQSPNQCTAASGTLTLGADCVVTQDFNFTTNIAIPDGTGGGTVGGEGVPVVNVQNVSGVTGNITDLNVDVQINHTWVGDLRVTLEHLGTSVMIIDLMGHATLDCGGCTQEDIDVILDDEGTGGPIEDQCVVAGLAASSPPNFTPANPLSAFDTLNPNGDWTLRVTDGCAADVGTLLGWSLHFANPAASPCAPSCTCKGDLNGSGTVNGADINKFAQCVASGGGAGCACADINGGGINSADVAPFVTALLSGTGCIP